MESFTIDPELLKFKFNSVCRICLQQEDEMISINDISTEIDPEVTIFEKIAQLIKIDNDERFPQQICNACLTDLEAGYRFIQNVQASEEILCTSYIEDENLEKELDEQELPTNDFFKNEIYADESEIVEINKSVEALEDTLLDEEQLNFIETKSESKKSMKEKMTKVKRNSKGSTSASSSSATSQQVHICEICANQYKYRHALEVHMRRHRGEKPFVCTFEHCHRSFVIRFELKRHMRVHTKDKPYNCRYCERKFSDFGSRIKHERSHTGERPYICQTCGKTFAYSHVLSGHMLTHTGEKKYECTTCGKRFTKAHHLKSHNNTHVKQMNKQNAIMQQQQQQSTTTPQINTALPQHQSESKVDEQEILNVVYL